MTAGSRTRKVRSPPVFGLVRPAGVLLQAVGQVGQALLNGRVGAQEACGGLGGRLRGPVRSERVRKAGLVVPVAACTGENGVAGDVHQADAAAGCGQGESDTSFGGDRPVRSAARRVDHHGRSHRVEDHLQAEGIAKVEVMPCRSVVVAGAGVERSGRAPARGCRLAYQLSAPRKPLPPMISTVMPPHATGERHRPERLRQKSPASPLRREWGRSEVQGARTPSWPGQLLVTRTPAGTVEAVSRVGRAGTGPCSAAGGSARWTTAPASRPTPAGRDRPGSRRRRTTPADSGTPPRNRKRLRGLRTELGRHSTPPASSWKTSGQYR